MINATLTLFSSATCYGEEETLMSGKRCRGQFKITFENWGPLFQMSGSTALAIEI